MTVSWHYIARNLVVRKLTTLLTAGGMALVVFVFATVLMMADGLRETLAGTGSASNVMVIRKSAQTEVQSSVERQQADRDVGDRGQQREPGKDLFHATAAAATRRLRRKPIRWMPNWMTRPTAIITQAT